MANVTLKGNPIHTVGQLPKVGRAGPKFRVTRGDLSDISFAGFEGKVKSLNIAPSLDTAVGAPSAHRFEKEAGDPRPTHDTTFVEGLDRAFYWQRLSTRGS